jgi:hypothetical protein
LTGVTTDGAVGMSPLDVIGPEFVVRHAVAHDVVRNFENLVADRDHRFFVPPMPLCPVIAGLQGGRPRVAGAERALNQRGVQTAIRLPRLAAPPQQTRSHAASIEDPAVLTGFRAFFLNESVADPRDDRHKCSQTSARCGASRFATEESKQKCLKGREAHRH